MPNGHVVLKMYVPCKKFHVPSQYSYKSCKAYVYCWKNKYVPRLKNHLPCRARNHKSLCAPGQDLHALGTWARLNVEPCIQTVQCCYNADSFLQNPHKRPLGRDMGVYFVYSNFDLYSSSVSVPNYCQSEAGGWPGTFKENFLQFYVYDLKFKAGGLTTFLTEFWTLPQSLQWHIYSIILYWTTL